jgi:CYTH domain-containing protein
VSIRDGLIAVYKDRKVRVRISGDIATIAIKGPRIGIVRPEFEYEIPIVDAERMLSTLCQDDTLEKQRFFVEDAGATWQVDVYGGILQGVVIAEIELKQESQELILPRWIGKEVTGDSFYKKVNMRARLNGSSPGALVPTGAPNRCPPLERLLHPLCIPLSARWATPIIRFFWRRG